MPTTTFRADVAAGVKTLLDVYMAANPTLLRSTAIRRPSSFATGELPCAYVGNRSEALTHDAGTRGREMTVAVEIVDWLSDSVETAARFDLLVDDLLDIFTGAPHGVSAGTILEPVGVEDDELTAGETVLAVGRILLRIRVLEGRS